MSEYLKQVLGDPLLGRYVKTIQVLGKQNCDGTAYPWPGLPEEDEHLLVQLTAETGFFRRLFPASDTAPSGWSPFGPSFAEPVLLALLLMRFSNATSLEVEAGFMDSNHRSAFCDSLREIRSYPSPGTLSSVYMRLSTTMEAFSLTEVQHFCALPSVKFLTVPNLASVRGPDSVEDEWTVE